MKTFQIDYLSLPIHEIKPEGELMVCLDPHKRLGPETWALVRSEGRNNIPIPMGLFRKKEDAVLFAESKEQLDKLKEDIYHAHSRLNNGRQYLMEVPADKITVENALTAFGWNSNGIGLVDE